MSLLHDYFNTRNLPLFHHLLDTSTGSDKSQHSAPSTSAKRASLSNHVDVNRRDWLGRTVLHLASASIQHLDYVRSLLRHPAVNVNLTDTESHWTPLHRSMYNANLPAARLLLQRADIDITIKDNEGYTAFDLYNSTLVGTKPPPEEGDAHADLYTWGTNVTAALGLGDSDDRIHPEQVVFPHKDDTVDLEKQCLSVRFLPVRVKHVEMSKLHTVVVTSESGGNLRVCGFGSGGRLGPNLYTQYLLKPLSQLNQTIISVALGQDHTLALTKSGEVLSWGLNRFSQLGYPVDPPIGGRTEEPIQYVPRKVQGPLRREIVKGVAASKVASACWTDDSVFTWGTNNGQLGYDKAAQPVQAQPRKVSRLTMPVISIAMTENVMACLMQNRQVECFYNDGQYRINFPTHTFPSPIRPYRPPQAVKDSHMAKITCCGDIFAALSSHGEVYIFSPSNTTSTSNASSSTSVTATNDAEGSTRTGGPFKCQRVWALLKKSSAVKDVALGADGSIIICTESGHVFVRARNAKISSSSLTSSLPSNQKAFKFVKIPGLQRITRVCASASGAFGALRVEFGMKSVEVKGSLVGQDLGCVVPWLEFGESKVVASVKSEVVDEKPIATFHSLTPGYGQDSDNEDVDGETEDDEIENDIRLLKEMCDAVKKEGKRRKEEEGPKLEEKHLPHGADTLVVIQPSGIAFPAHRAILGARSEILCRILSVGTKKKKGSSALDEQRNIKISLLPPLQRHPTRPTFGPGTKEVTQLSITGAQPLSVLIFLNYLYSDNVVAIWDRRISFPVDLYAKQLGIKVGPVRIKSEIQGLARALELGAVLKVLERPVKSVAEATLVRDLIKLFDVVNSPAVEAGAEDAEETKKIPKALRPDVILELEDRTVFTHSVVLRSRSEFFKGFFDEPDWTRNRWEEVDDNEGLVVRVDLKHLKWRSMEFVLRFMCCGCDKELFERLEFVKGVDDLVEFMFEVMAAANELLLDRLVLLCSDVILTYSSLHNACYVLSEATYFSATQLIDRIQSHITANMELFLEAHMLDDIPQDLLIQLANHAQRKQKEKTPFIRGGQLEDQILEKWEKWVEELDVPVPFVRSNKPWKEKRGLAIPKFEKLGVGGDDIFMMDDTDVNVSQSVGGGGVGTAGPAWKAYVAPKVDMKSVMAEAAASQIKPGIKSNKSNETLRTPLKSQGTLAASPQATTKGSPSGSPRRIQQVQQQGTSSSSQLTPTKPTQGFLGPTIAPIRMSASSSKSTTGQRNISGSSKAWTHTRPIIDTPTSTTTQITNPNTPTTTTTSKDSKSFLAIQHSQQEEQISLFGDRDKRSLLDIQEEEKARREEEEFLRWWEEEEGRVKMEMESVRVGHQGQKQKRGGGGGRGKASGGNDRSERRGGRGGGTRSRKEGKNPHDGSSRPQESVRGDNTSSRPARQSHRKPSQKVIQEQVIPMSSGP